MPSLRKRAWPSGKVTWDIRYWQDGKRKIFTIGETDRRTAEKIFHKFCSNLAEGEIDGAGTASNQSTNDQIQRLSGLAELARTFAVTNKSLRTLEREQQVFTRIISVMGDLLIADLTPDKLEDYKAKRLVQSRASTVNIEIRVLNTALNQAIALGWISHRPHPRFRQIRVTDSEPPDWLTEEEVSGLLGAAAPEFRLFLSFLLNTGCRRNEALGLTWEDIDLDKRQIIVRGQVGKMGKRRTVPINSGLLETLQNWPRDPVGKLFPDYGPNQVTMKFRRLAKAICLRDGISLHSLRSTFACHLIKRGVDIYTVSRLLGHSSVRVTEKHYVALESDHVLSAVEKLNFLSISPPRV